MTTYFCTRCKKQVPSKDHLTRMGKWDGAKCGECMVELRGYCVFCLDPIMASDSDDYCARCWERKRFELKAEKGLE